MRVEKIIPLFPFLNYISFHSCYASLYMPISRSKLEFWRFKSNPWGESYPSFFLKVWVGQRRSAANSLIVIYLSMADTGECWEPTTARSFCMHIRS